MKPYTLLIAGHHFDGWDTCRGVFSMLSNGIAEAFRALPHVTVKTARVQDQVEGTYQPCDFIIAVCFIAEDVKFTGIKTRTGARGLVSLRENGMDCDHSFYFTGECANGTYIRLPCCKRLLQRSPKVPGSILVDHTWWIEDRTAEIEGWLEGYDLGPVSRLIRPTTENHPVPAWMGSVEYKPYPDYLKAVSTFERHVLTHIEGYQFGVVEMAAQGTQILAPVRFVPQRMVDELGIRIFNTKDELLGMLREPVEPSWASAVDLCTDYGDCARIMDEKFQEWLT